MSLAQEENANPSVLFLKYFCATDKLLYKYFRDSNGPGHTNLHLLFVVST